MKKTLSVILAVITIITLLTGVSASAASVGIAITADEAKAAAAEYLGVSADSFGNYSCTARDVEIVNVIGISVKVQEYDLSFRCNGVSYKITVDSVGGVRNYSYDSNRILVPKGYGSVISEAEAKAKATDAAGVNSSDAIFTSSRFVVEDYVGYYKFDFLGKTQQVSAKVNASVKSAAPEISVTEKNAIVMIFIRLFAKIAMIFG